MPAFLKIQQLMNSGVEEGVFPGAVLLVGRGEETLLHRAYGWAALLPEKQPLQPDTLFDLASLTKPLATTLGIMALIEKGLLELDQPWGAWWEPFPFPEMSPITIRQILAHSAGFQAYKPYFLDLIAEGADPKNHLRQEVMRTPLACLPGSQTLYSDLGFIVLEWIFTLKTRESLDSWIRKNLYHPLGLPTMGFRPLTAFGVAHPERYAATEDCPWRKKILQGEVHDENTFAVGGVSGQAGLFGTAEEVFRLLRALKRAYDLPQPSGLFNTDLVRLFWERQDRPPGTTRALGFDTPSERDSSAGRFFSRNSVGHLGYTGTSFWLDLERDLTVTLLTNRVHPTRANEKIKTFRPLLHDLVYQEVMD